MTSTYRQTLALVAQLSVQERQQLRSDLEEMANSDLTPADWIDALLEEGEQSIQAHGTLPLTKAFWTDLKAPYAG